MAVHATALLEARDPASRRAAAGLAAGADVRLDQLALERDSVAVFLKRLQQLRRELQGIIAAPSTSEFRRFTASSLITEIDALITQATIDLRTLARPTFTKAAQLGIASVDEPIKAASVAITASPHLDRALVTVAFDTTVDLLSEPMLQFRNQIVQGVRRAAIGGESAFTQLQQLAQKIDAAGFDAAAFKAERIYRTEISRVLNGATYDRLTALAETFPFLRKGWRATKDSRTRLGHVEAAATYGRGSGIKIADRFRVNVYQEFPPSAKHPEPRPPKFLGVATLRYPSDPDTTPAGRLAAATTILCRCNSFTDFDVADLQAFSTARTSVPVHVPAFTRGDVGLL
jgi:hypothetical protein